MDRRAIGLSLLTGGTLLCEVALTRALSISFFHHLAFLVVSTALLGLSAAGTVVAMRGPVDADRAAGLGALGFAVATPLCFALAQWVELEPLAVVGSAGQLAKLGIVYVVLALPFFSAGLAVATLLDRYASEAPRLYAADLLGAGAGSFLALAALSAVGSRGALCLGAALGAGGAAMLRRNWIFALPAAALVALAPFASRVLPIYVSHAKVSLSGEPFDSILRDPARTVETTESSIARVDRVEFGRGEARLFIDAGVAAVRIPPDDFRPAPSDATLPYELRPEGPALIIGSGAGWEIAEALRFGTGRVDAVEINREILAHTPDAIARDPRVRIIHDEGRTFLEARGDPYGAIVMIHTISNAATSAGALHLAEDYLLTVEAMRAALERLTPDGFLLITRPEAQLPRLILTLTEALETDRPAEHILAWVEVVPNGRSFYAAVLVGRSPITDVDRERILARLAERTRLRAVAVPGRAPSDALLAAILAKKPTAELEAIAGFRLDAPTDDRPFFHQRRRFFEISFDDLSFTDENARLALEDRPFSELSAVALLVETTAIGAVLLVLPLIAGRERERTSKRRVFAALGYFALLGLGFMLIEVSLIQRLSLLLGRPAIAFATVFAGLLVGAGIGSRLSERLTRKKEATTLAALTALALALLLPLVLRAALDLPQVARIAVALILVLPAGLALGMPFPLGLVEAAKGGGRLVPWAFAANGIASIAGTVLALILATEIGLTAVLGLAVLLYGLARVLFVRLGRDA